MFSIFSCQKNEIEENDILIKYRVTFGFCGGYCTSYIEIENRNIIYTRSSRDSIEYPKIQLNNKMSIKEWNSLLVSINMDSILSLPNIIGCPDCADGGAEWIEIITADTLKSVIFEYWDTIDPINNTIEILREMDREFYCELYPEYCQ
ncbi:MAG: hypothetical protein HOB40_07735 [Candidatus Marinimicrobia bacterium]|nr:hypothetical protein [Candidatus Neomarinimicrobiota bacterium]MBT4578722.1 hypothetical protein [Candidatus Neomarinimicrobiota bacterium]MBT4958246.1 hypothetical protein [Candidatus Neomarinimicrobiota bacterium]MBT5460591.1 hypothetical protein [Candidatus Neomarinimicrobiota bacterium]MBT6632845.1 hypothetical protein [Candidatus Neomarinimicrobiota bacterium]